MGKIRTILHNFLYNSTKNYPKKDKVELPKRNFFLRSIKKILEFYMCLSYILLFLFFSTTKSAPDSEIHIVSLLHSPTFSFFLFFFCFFLFLFLYPSPPSSQINHFFIIIFNYYYYYSLITWGWKPLRQKRGKNYVLSIWKENKGGNGERDLERKRKTKRKTKTKTKIKKKKHKHQEKEKKEEQKEESKKKERKKQVLGSFFLLYNPFKHPPQCRGGRGGLLWWQI